MDSINNIGGSWNNLTPIGGAPAHKPAVTPASTPEASPAPMGDRVDVSAAPAAPAAAAPAAPQAQAPAARAEITPSSVPTSLLADEGSLNLLGVNSGASAHPTTGLGVLAQLDETSGIRAIDNGSGNNRFADLHLVGVHNAGQFLNNPGAMYLGI